MMKLKQQRRLLLIELAALATGMTLLQPLLADDGLWIEPRTVDDRLGSLVHLATPELDNHQKNVSYRMRDGQTRRPVSETVAAQTQQLENASFPAKSNEAYGSFKQGRWRKAHLQYSEILKSLTQQKKRKASSQIKTVLRLRKLVCALKAGEQAENDGITAHSVDSNELEFYLNQAAMNFDSGRSENAIAWIDAAIRIYGERRLSAFQMIFIDTGWLEFPRSKAITLLSGLTVPVKIAERESN